MERAQPVNLQLEQVASPQLAADTEIEERQFPPSAKDLKPDPDSLNLLQFEQCLLTNKSALVPRPWNAPNFKLIHSSLLKVEEPEPDVILSVVARCRCKVDIADRGWALAELRTGCPQSRYIGVAASRRGEGISAFAAGKKTAEWASVRAGPRISRSGRSHLNRPVR
jgi:hypothetical protein